MKAGFVLLNLLWIYQFAFAQSASITNDGNYVYTVCDSSKTKSGVSLAVIRSTQTGESFEISGCRNISFTNDSKKAIYLKADTLFVLNLSDHKTKSFTGVAEYVLCENNYVNWVIYKSMQGPGKVVFYDLNNGNEQYIESVGDYSVNSTSTAMLTKSASGEKNVNLVWIDLERKIINAKTIWSGEDSKLGKSLFNDKSKQVLFMVNDGNKEHDSYSIWYYDEGDIQSSILVNNSNEGVESDLEISADNAFSLADPPFLFVSKDKVLFYLSEKLAIDTSKGVKIYSYLDAKIQSQQLAQKIERKYATVVNIHSKKLVRIEVGCSKLIAQCYYVGNLGGIRSPAINEKIALVQDFPEDVFMYETSSSGKSFFDGGYSAREASWNKKAQPKIYLVNLEDGSRRLIYDRIAGID
ncbi:MAG: hypothetical protein J7497_07725, partial [Chitinophagaceae bacterium]|nr:hypothetical protein [Chitinophagaceae bacterium]